MVSPVLHNCCRTPREAAATRRGTLEDAGDDLVPEGRRDGAPSSLASRERTHRIRRDRRYGSRRPFLDGTLDPDSREFYGSGVASTLRTFRSVYGLRPTDVSSRRRCLLSDECRCASEYHAVSGSGSVSDAPFPCTMSSMMGFLPSSST